MQPKKQTKKRCKCFRREHSEWWIGDKDRNICICRQSGEVPLGSVEQFFKKKIEKLPWQSVHIKIFANDRFYKCQGRVRLCTDARERHIKLGNRSHCAEKECTRRERFKIKRKKR